MTFLSSLPLGARFRTESGRVGMLLRVGAMSCRVRWDNADVRPVRINEHEFTPLARATDVAPQTEVMQIADPLTEATL